VTAPLPDGFRITLDADARRLDDTTWFGGSPRRLLRLSAAGRRAFDALLTGPVDSRNTGILARRLTDAGLAHPRPPVAAAPDVTVVIPVRDRADLLDRCLAALGSRYPVVVVDDGSRDPHAVAHTVARHGATRVRRPVNGGAGPARNSGVAHVTTELVAFVDSDCESSADWIDRLAGHFADPLVAAVAPRVAGELDHGDRPALVHPHGRVSHVPTAALLVRRTLATFDETIRRGEDTDLVWRLHEEGWRVRYDPTVTVHHNEATSRPLARRFRYGKSAAPLAVRHPTAIRPLVLYPLPTLAVLALLARRPLAALAAYAVSVFALRRTTSPVDNAPKVMADAVYQTWRGIGRYAVRYASPVLAIAILAPGSSWRRAAACALLACGRIEDVAYGLGVWHGCVTERTIAPVRPVIARHASGRNAN
jgi:mycofactocin system glycosyltransferase